MNKFITINYVRIIFLLSIWTSFFFSINLSPLEFYNLSILNKFRISLPLVLMIFFLLFEFKNLRFSNYINFYQIFFLIIIFLYFYFNIVSHKNVIGNIFWPIYMFLSFFFLISLNKQSDFDILLKSSFLIVALGFIFYLSTAIFEMIRLKNPFFYGIGIDYSYVKDPPRSSGLSRLSLLIFISLTIYYFIRNKRDNYLFLILITLTGFFTLVFQSRTISFIFYVLLVLNILFNFKKFFFDKKLIIFCLIFPFILFISYNFFSQNHKGKLKNIDNPIVYIVKDSVLRFQESAPKTTATGSLLNKKDYELDRFSSNRFADWKSAITVIKKNNFIGHGAQSDRVFINQSVHNAFLYTALSGGVISALSLIFIYLLSFFYFIKVYIFKDYPYLKEFEAKLLVNIIIILNLRSLLETSFAVFSIDYLIYILSFVYLSNLLKKNNNI